MPLLKGSLTGRRFHVVGAVPEDFRTSFPALLQGHAFHAPASPIAREQIVGWTFANDLFGVDFDRLDAWLFNQYAVLGVRVEQKVLPSRLLQGLLKTRLAAWCQEHKRERAPASVRTEIRELLEDELLAKSLPRVNHHEVIWNLVEGWVLVGHASDSVIDLVKNLFKKTFGLRLQEVGSAAFLPDHGPAWDALSALGATRLGDFVAPPDPVSQLAAGSGLLDDYQGRLDLETIGMLLPHTLSDFLLWLWWKSETQEGRFETPDAGIIDAWVDDRVVTREEASKRRSTLQAEHVSQERAAGAALLSGQVVTEARIGLRREGREYTFTLKGSGFTLATAKLPTECKGAEDEVLYERMYLYEDLVFALGELYRLFLAERLDAHGWAAWSAPSMQAWAAAMAQAGTTENADPEQVGDEDSNVTVAAAPADLADGPVQLVGGAGEILARGEVRGGEVRLARMSVRGRPAPVLAPIPAPRAQPARARSSAPAEVDADDGVPPDLRALIRDADRWLRGDDLPDDGVLYVEEVLRKARDLAEALEGGAELTAERQRAIRGWKQGVAAWSDSRS